MRGIECELKLAGIGSRAYRTPLPENKTKYTEAKKYAVENIPRYNEELEAADEDDDLFGKIVEDESADPDLSIPSGGGGRVNGQGQSREPSGPAPPGSTTSGAMGGD